MNINAKPTTFKLPFIAAKLQSQSQPNPDAAPPEQTGTNSTKLPPRPILTHLNADTTWLLLLPYPPNTSPAPPCRYYRILFDPWLAGPQSDVYAWFSTQWHATPSSIGTISELSEFIRSVDGEGPNERGIDAVFISHEFTDHCHKETLLQIPGYVPVFANDKAFDLIRGWGHFESVLQPVKFPSLGVKNGEVREWDWRVDGRRYSYGCGGREGGYDEEAVLPNWIGITRIESPGNALYYHSSVMVTFTSTADEEEIVNVGEGTTVKAECILYTPHGTAYSTLGDLQICKPKIEPLALLHGLHDVKVGLVTYKQLNLGAENGIKCVSSCGGVKYWIGTHDEQKIAGGMIKRMLWRKPWKVGEVPEESSGGIGGAWERYVEVGSGETLVLA
ncbi:hypothetical protein ABW19_dt0206671 [Dactylella cylindrospora]|nr:hypothetical protein ABW19_dt0206671 [Dactylella cylindrospora]